MKKFSTLLVAGCLLLITITGCASGPKPVEVDVTLSEFAFAPEGIQTEAGAQMMVTLDNEGALEHNFLVMDKGVVVTEWTDSDQANVFFEQLALPAGQNTTVTFSAPTEPGTYQIVCSVPGHLTQGMQGTLTVTAP